MTLDKNPIEVLVVGGGMVGAATALGLAQAGMRVHVLEKNSAPAQLTDSAPFHPRVSALTRASEHWLRDLGAWPAIEAYRLTPFRAMHVRPKASTDWMTLDSASLAEPNLGHIVENHAVQTALWSQLQAAQSSSPTRLTYAASALARLEKVGAHWVAETLDGEILKPQLVVAADGALSPTRAMAGIEVDTHEYGQAAIVGCVETEHANQQSCWQLYQDQGPFAYLPLGTHCQSIAWYLPVSEMDAVLSLSDAAFANGVTQASQGLLGEVTAVGERAGFPIVRRHAQSYVQDGLALVGDAAHTIHPQAGQGVNLGFLDASALVEVVTQARQTHPNHWMRRSVLRRYERWRRGDNAVVQRAMEGFEWLFADAHPLAQAMRQQVMPSMARWSGPKQWLISQALYGRGRLPKACEAPGTLSDK